MKLKFKLLLITAFPILLFSFVSFVFVWENLEKYNQTKLIHSEMDVIRSASALVNETQKERGITASFYSGASSLNKLNSQRVINQEKFKDFKKNLEGSLFTQKYKDLFSDLEAKFQNIHSKVDDKKISLKSALTSYSDIITHLLSINIYVAKHTELSVIASELRSLRILEEAKESGGKLRANVSGVLANNSAISDEKLRFIVNLKSGIVSNLKSHGVVLDKKVSESIKQFYSLKEWKNVDDTFQKILVSAKVGEYGKDSNTFFNEISVALNIITYLLKYKKDKINKAIIKIEKRALSNLIIISLSFVIVLVGVSLVSWKVSTSVTNTVSDIADNLSIESKQLVESSSALRSSSQGLSSSSQQQASSVQETSASLTEISSMVQRNSESAIGSTKLNEDTKNAAVVGQRVVNETVSSLKEIEKSVNDISNAIDRSNDEIKSIVDIISEIGEKTSVINDIVFQTKLLSFNASVEAARAGEHGKGFAVVAEEVGNLAQMSGSAANEISSMLEDSIKKVSDTVDRTQTSISELVTSNKSIVASSSAKATECGSALETILEKIQRMTLTVEQIADASQEQSSGVREISTAIEEIDSSTQHNADIADQSLGLANSLTENANKVDLYIKSLNELVTGVKSNADKSNQSEKTEVELKKSSVDFENFKDVA